MAILFYHGEDISLNNLAKTLEVDKKQIKEAIEKIREKNQESVFLIVENNDRVLLSLKAKFAPLIEKIKSKEEMTPLSTTALETLSVILYKKEITKYHLDEIRGVNSSHILRNLMVRGLVDRKIKDGNYFYFPTMDLISYLGVEKLEDLPAFEKVQEKIKAIEEDVFNKKENGGE